MTAPSHRALLDARYEKTEKGRARKARYNRSQKNRVVQERWRGTLPAILVAVRDVANRRGTR